MVERARVYARGGNMVKLLLVERDLNKKIPPNFTL